MGDFKIDLNTGNRFWTPKGLGAVGMDPHRAIAELVANSLDWRRLNSDNVIPIIKVIVSAKGVEVRDNGVGMTTKELQEAIQVSVTNDRVRPNLRLRKGMFGMGMKVACLSLGWKISFHTRPLSQKNVENRLILNTRNLDDDGTANTYRKNIKGESGAWVQNGPLGDWESGTAILIEDLTHKNLTAVAVRDSYKKSLIRK
ncbi:MAG: ATP-binding protein [Segetibacter sp.]